MPKLELRARTLKNSFLKASKAKLNWHFEKYLQRQSIIDSRESITNHKITEVFMVSLLGGVLDDFVTL